MIAELLTPTGAAYVLTAAVFVYYILPYLQLWRLRDIPSPGFAAFSNLWLMLQARQGHRFITVDNAHKKHGKLVRIAPRHISIADDEAIQAVYGHGNGFLKAYVSSFLHYSPRQSTSSADANSANKTTLQKKLITIQ